MAEDGHKRSEREGSRGHKRSGGRARGVPAAEVAQVPVRDLPVVPREVGDGGWPPWVGVRARGGGGGGGERGIAQQRGVGGHAERTPGLLLGGLGLLQGLLREIGRGRACSREVRRDA